MEKISGENWLGFCGIDAPIIPMISLEQQFAEKLHSYTLPRDRTNTRAKDLIDLILLLRPENKQLQVFKQTLQRVFKARNTHPLPTVLPEPPESWQKAFTEMASECGISLSLSDSYKKVSTFYIELSEMGKL